jgi:hypothetical protein
MHWRLGSYWWVNKLESLCIFITFMLVDEQRLCLGMLMHVKCIHDLFSLLSHILSYLIVLWGHGLVFHWLQGFLNNPLSFGFNTANWIFLFLYVLTFRVRLDVKRTQTFATSFFREIEDHEKKMLMGDATRTKRGPTTWATTLAAWWGPPFCLELCFKAILNSMNSSWPKTDYIYPSSGDFARGGRETRNTHYRYADCKDRRGDAIGAASGCPFDSIDTIYFSNMIKRE